MRVKLININTNKKCLIDNCDSPARSKGLCKHCYERDYRSKNREKVRERNRQYAIKNREKVLKMKRDYYRANPDKCKKAHRDWYDQNKEKKATYEKRYRFENLEKCRKYSREYTARRVKEDPLFKLKRDIRRLINVSLAKRGYSKNTRTYALLGTDYESLIKHLYQSFINRYGREPTDDDEIQIDHIIPCDAATDRNSLERLQFYKNLNG